VQREHERGSGIGVKLEVATECCWSCELRYTRHPNHRTGLDRSIVCIVFFAGGGATAEEPLASCLDRLEREMAKPEADKRRRKPASRL